MKILIVEPGQEPRVAEVSNELKALQEIVQGYIEAVRLPDGELLVCNEEGKFMENLEWNRVVMEIGAIIRGTFFICGFDSDVGFKGLTDKQIEKYAERFKFYERIRVMETEEE